MRYVTTTKGGNSLVHLGIMSNRTRPFSFFVSFFFSFFCFFSFFSCYFFFPFFLFFFFFLFLLYYYYYYYYFFAFSFSFIYIYIYTIENFRLKSRPIEKPGAVLIQVQVPGTARDFSPTVNFQCRLSYGVRTAPV